MLFLYQIAWIIRGLGRGSSHGRVGRPDQRFVRKVRPGISPPQLIPVSATSLIRGSFYHLLQEGIYFIFSVYASLAIIWSKIFLVEMPIFCS